LSLVRLIGLIGRGYAEHVSVYYVAAVDGYESVFAVDEGLALTQADLIRYCLINQLINTRHTKRIKHFLLLIDVIA